MQFALTPLLSFTHAHTYTSHPKFHFVKKYIVLFDRILCHVHCSLLMYKHSVMILWKKMEIIILGFGADARHIKMPYNVCRYDILFYFTFFRFVHSIHSFLPSAFNLFALQPAIPEMISAEINIEKREIFYSIRMTMVYGRHAALQMVFMNLLDFIWYSLMWLDKNMEIHFTDSISQQNEYWKWEKGQKIDKNMLSNNGLSAFWQNSVVNLFLTIYSRLPNYGRWCIFLLACNEFNSSFLLPSNSAFWVFFSPLNEMNSIIFHVRWRCTVHRGRNSI